MFIALPYLTKEIQSLGYLFDYLFLVITFEAFKNDLTIYLSISYA
jgi:hypothetical protein